MRAVRFVSQRFGDIRVSVRARRNVGRTQKRIASVRCILVVGTGLCYSVNGCGSRRKMKWVNYGSFTLYGARGRRAYERRARC
jgi:hypothetical protein